MIGQTISHYCIIRRIGAGGMGEVYCAADTKLGRDVALKILPPDVAADPERLERFRREARALAAINHPHIVTIYSVEEADGVHFLTMELVEGQSLDHCIPEGGLPLERLEKIAIALADALAAAHEKGIVHRDLKPANVMITTGVQIKVLDFGLAKEMRVSGADDATRTSAGHTEVGVVMGTPSYMSPEQIAGRPIDHRTDIFSLGVILYEMSVAQRPFKGASPAELVSAILRDTPPLVTDIRANLPAGLARIIRRCLEKSVADRFPSARELCNELGNMLSTAPTTAIAVLPFQNISDDPGQEYFADGITEEIINSLAHIPGLRVAGRSSSFSFKGRNEDLRSVGAKLGVNTILEGTLRRAGNRLRITAQLIDASTGYQLWSERYDRVMEDVFALQDEIAGTIAERLRLSLAADRDGQYAQPPTKNIAAYELYVKGRYYWNKRTPADIQAAISFFNQAIDKDPGYGLAYAGVADAYFFLSPSGGDVIAKSNAAAERALELDPTLARPHAVLGYNKIAYKYDFSSGEAEFRKALELDSRDATAHQWFAENLSYLGGRGQEAIGEASLAHELDPLSPVIGTALAQTYYFDRQFDKAIEACNKVIADNPGFGTAHAWLATSVWAEHKYPQAIQEWETAAQLGGEKNYAEYAAGLAAGFRAGGWPNAVRKGIEIRLAQRNAKNGYVSSTRIAQLYADLGEKDHAFEWLDIAYQERDFWLITLRSDARFDSLRSDPRYAELVRKIGFP
jgi:serine/threonine protein kinase